MRVACYRMPDGTEGKVPVMSGMLPKGAKYILKDGVFYPNHKATDFYHHYKEDIALLGEMGFRALNLSISWARIYPYGVEKGVNQKGVGEAVMLPGVFEMADQRGVVGGVIIV